MTTEWGQDNATVEGGATSRDPATVDALLAENSGGYDTLDIAFSQAEISDAGVHYTDGYPHEPGSGREVEMRGNQFLEIVLDAAELPEGAVEVSEGDNTPVISDVRVLGQRHNDVHIGVGLSTAKGTAPKVDFRLRSEPDQGVIHLDVRHVE